MQKVGAAAHLVLGLCLTVPALGKSVKIRGYVTSVNSPTEFEIEDYRITRDSTVVLELEKSNDPQEKSTFNPDEIRVGTEMEIQGELDESTNQLTAKNIKVQLDENQHVKRTALAVTQPILHKAGNGWEGQVQVDGQHVTVTPDTAVTFKPNNSQKKAAKSQQRDKAKKSAKPADDLDIDETPGVALTEAGRLKANTFVSYEGTRQKDGTILATKMEFVENELTSGEAKLWKRLTPKVKNLELIGSQPGEVNISRVGKYKLVPDPKVQRYIADLGMSLVPAYQRDLPSEDPQKIHFRFFVVQQKAPNAFALANGTVVVYAPMVTTLENEAQLAAVLSHEIAHAMEEHTYRQMQYHKKALLALKIGGAVGSAYGGVFISEFAKLTEAAIRNGYSRILENQADRVGMQYMVAAGYDPREAARVWKVMGMKHGDHFTNVFWSNHDNHTTRRSYLMAELKNNYAGVDFDHLKRNTDGFTAAVEGINSHPGKKGGKTPTKN